MTAVAVADPTQITQDEARKYAGHWVAIKDGSVQFAAEDPKDVLEWLKRSHIEPDLVAALPAEGASDTWQM